MISTKRRDAVPEKRMNTKQAEYKTEHKTDIANLAGKIDAAMERAETDIATMAGQIDAGMERIRTDIARSDKQLLLAVFGMMSLATLFLGFLIGLD